MSQFLKRTAALLGIAGSRNALIIRPFALALSHITRKMKNSECVPQPQS